MSNPLQKGISFTSIDDFMDFLPADQRKITEALRSIILETLPHCTEKLSYNIPFYSLNKRICFIWPSAIPWGGLKEGVSIGFARGELLAHYQYLEKGNRKSVYSKTFVSVMEIDSKIVEALLLEAASIDQYKVRNCNYNGKS